MIKKTIKLLKLNCYFFALGSCAGLRGAKPDPDSLQATHYSLRLEKEQKQSIPLPSYTPIMVDWHYKSGATVSKLAFKAWDFNGDSRFDMIQAVEESGLGEAVYDFDFDGQIDLRRPGATTERKN